MHSFAWWPIVIALGAATVMDLWVRRIPNWLTLPFLAGGLVTAGIQGGLPGIGRSIAGIGVAALVLAGFCCLGGMGWGDLKLYSAIGAWVGPGQLAFALLMTFIVGGVQAVGCWFWHGRRRARPARLKLDDPAALKMPYAPAIALGTLFSFFAR